MKDRGVEQRWTKLSTKNRGKEYIINRKGNCFTIWHYKLRPSSAMPSAARRIMVPLQTPDRAARWAYTCTPQSKMTWDMKSQRRVSNGIHTSQTEASCRTCSATANRHNGLLNFLRYSRSATTFESRRMASTSPPSPGSFTCQCCQRLWRCAGSS